MRTERGGMNSEPAKSRPDWYRRKTWTPQDEMGFRTRLERSRGAFQKAQYLKIQAITLLGAGIFEPALSLLEQAAADYPDEERSAVALYRAEALWSLGSKHRSFAAYNVALEAQRAEPNVQHSVALSFAERFHDFENGAHRRMLIDVLHAETVAEECAILFPAHAFRYAVAFARLYDGIGDADSAARSARLALEAQKQTHSGFQKHPKLGLVENTDESLDRWLVALSERK